MSSNLGDWKMGVHQYKLDLLPSAFAGEASGDVSEIEDFWSEQPPSALLQELRSLLPKETSWGGVEEFESANDWGSDLRIWHNGRRDGPVYSIAFRFAPVSDGEEVLERFLTIAARHGLLVYSRASGHILQPSIEIVEQDLKQSTAYRFIADPGAAIEEAAATVKIPKLIPKLLD